MFCLAEIHHNFSRLHIQIIFAKEWNAKKKWNEQLNRVKKNTNVFTSRVITKPNAETNNISTEQFEYLEHFHMVVCLVVRTEKLDP